MDHKPQLKENRRSNSKGEQKSATLRKKKKSKSRELPSTHVPTRPISVGKSTLNSKQDINCKQDSVKKDTPNLRPLVIPGWPNYLLTESRYSCKQPRSVDTSKQPHGQVQRASNHVGALPIRLCNLHGQVKVVATEPQPLTVRGIEQQAPRVSKKNQGTPKTVTTNGSKSTGVNKPRKLQCSRVMPCNNPEVQISVPVRTTTPRLRSAEEGEATKQKIPNPISEEPKGCTPEVLANVVSCNVRDANGIPSNAACLTELARKEHYYGIQGLVEKAIKNHKIFLIRGDIPYLEESMTKRGWVQKYESTKTRMAPYGSVASLDAPSLGSIQSQDGNFNEKAIIFQMLRHVPPDFIWDCRNDFTEWNSNIKQTTLLNRFQKSFVYTSKLGMATILEDAHWNYEEKVSTVQCPRSYNVGRDRNAFIDDYRITAAVSLLKWFVEQIQKGVEHAVRGSSPIPLRQIEFAIKQCEQLVTVANNDHLDTPQPEVLAQEWDLFIHDYIKAVHQENGFIEITNGPPFPEIEMLYVTANAVLKKVKEIDPQYELNGHRNIWILKPSDLCCGTGIVMTHKLSHIMKRVQDCAKDYFVVQKYIERLFKRYTILTPTENPLLVQDTKFDVRQWYLVTKSYPLTIWIYKESLLRFSSRPFSFSNYHEAVHICNTAVQCKYNEHRNSVRAMNWDCQKMNEHLKKAGYNGEPWYDQVYPKMCEAIIATMLAAQQHMDKRRCSFELYGADFMIMNDLSVWLIEINTNPRMHPPSTKVTERLYPEVMESLVKVILDYPGNPNADTGNFVLAYQQNVTTFQPYLGASMFVLGKTIDQKSKNIHDRESSMNPWPPLLQERQNGVKSLISQNDRHENSSFPNTPNLCSG